MSLTNGTTNQEATENGKPMTNGDSNEAHVNKTDKIRNKFEKGETEKQQRAKRPTKVHYAGVASAKNKFIEEAERVNLQQANADRGPRQITPPREGVNSGVIESQPQSRAPGVVSGDDPVHQDDLGAIIKRTKDLRAKFKQMEEGGLTQEEKHKVIAELNELSPADISKIKSQWKEMMNGQNGTKEKERKKIDLTEGAANSGVFESEPKMNENVVRYDDKSDSDNFLSVLNSKEKKEALLRMAEESAKSGTQHKINPAEELKMLAEQQKNSVFENDPQDRPDGLVSHSTDLEDYKGLSSAKSTREKFLDGSAFTVEVKKTVVEILAEQGGVYENEPQQRMDVVKCDDFQPNETGGAGAKWASEAKRRLMESQKNEDKSQKPLEEIGQGKFATDAREKFIQKQKAVEEASNRKDKPQIIDIWSELCEDSGVFENQPVPRSKDIVVSGAYSDEEEDQAPANNNNN